MLRSELASIQPMYGIEPMSDIAINLVNGARRRSREHSLHWRRVQPRRSCNLWGRYRREWSCATVSRPLVSSTLAVCAIEKGLEVNVEVTACLFLMALPAIRDVEHHEVEVRDISTSTLFQLAIIQLDMLSGVGNPSRGHSWCTFEFPLPFRAFVSHCVLTQ